MDMLLDLSGVVRVRLLLLTPLPARNARLQRVVSQASEQVSSPGGVGIGWYASLWVGAQPRGAREDQFGGLLCLLSQIRLSYALAVE